MRCAATLVLIGHFQWTNHCLLVIQSIVSRLFQPMLNPPNHQVVINTIHEFCRAFDISPNAAWADTNWIEVSNSGPVYQDYYELAGTNFSVFPTSGISAPQLGTTNEIDLYTIGSRLMMATIRNGILWTCQTVGLNGTNGSYTGDASGTNVDRSAVQWLAFGISPDATTLTLADHGRIFDSRQQTWDGNIFRLWR